MLLPHFCVKLKILLLHFTPRETQTIIKSLPRDILSKSCIIDEALNKLASCVKLKYTKQ